MSQLERIIRILTILSDGKGMTVRRLYEHFEHKVTLRTLQRDMFEISNYIPLEQKEGENRQITWRFPRHYRGLILPDISRNEIISLHLLKGYLKTFNNTTVEKDTNSLLKKIERIAPGEVLLNFEQEEIIWDQNAGQFDYAKFDRELTWVLDAIFEGKAVTVEYVGVGQSTSKQFEAVLQRLFVYRGTLYAACYQPYYKNYLALTVQGIVDISAPQNTYDTPFIFNKEEFLRDRFGVFQGEIKHVMLQVAKTIAVYLRNRTWHASQKVTEQTSGGLILEMDVPISPELLSWILGWGAGIRVVEPEELAKSILTMVENIVALYGVRHLDSSGLGEDEPFSRHLTAVRRDSSD